MKVSRTKFIRKYLRFFRIVFGIEPPFNVILDGNFIYHALKYSVNVVDRFQKTLQGAQVKFYILRSALDELNALGEKGGAALVLANAYCETIEDDFIDTKVSRANTSKKGSGGSSSGDSEGSKANSCLAHFKFLNDSAKKGDHRYFLATQDHQLRKSAAKVPGVPILYLNKVSLVLEAPSEASLAERGARETSRSAVSALETEVLSLASDAQVHVIGGDSGSAGPSNASVRGGRATGNSERKKKRASSANPLSNKKADPDSQASKKKKSKMKKKFKGKV